MIIAYYALHYGKEYLEYSIKSIENHVDKIIFLYSDKPSFGHTASLECPDSEEELLNIITSVKKDTLLCRVVGSKNEGFHRDRVYGYAKPDDIIFHVDADEIWDSKELEKNLEIVKKTNYKEYLANAIHFFRSFKWVCKDSLYPIRFIRKSGEGTHYLPGKFYHFGYAQKPDTVKYKMDIHGHKNELKPNWFEDTFLKFPEVKENLHPTCRDVWKTEVFNKNELPDFMNKHPYFDKEIIE